MDARCGLVVVGTILFIDGGTIDRGVELRDDAVDPRCLEGDLLGDFET